MFKIEYDLKCLTCEELIEMRREIKRAYEELTEYQHNQQLSDAERHVIAEALGIDEETGEWRAGA